MAASIGVVNRATGSKSTDTFADADSALTTIYGSVTASFIMPPIGSVVVSDQLNLFTILGYMVSSSAIGAVIVT